MLLLLLLMMMMMMMGGQGGGLREELDTLGNGLRRVGASLCGSIENLVNHCSFSCSLTTAAAGKPLQIGHRRIKVGYTCLADCQHTHTHARTYAGPYLRGLRDQTPEMVN